MTQKSNADNSKKVKSNSSQTNPQSEYEKVDELLETVAHNSGNHDSATPKVHGVKKAKNSNLNYWFWGTIALLLFSTLSLAIIAQFNVGSDDRNVEEVTEVTPVQNAQSNLPKELSANEIRGIFDKTYQPALDFTLALAYDLIEQAYQPVYRNISSYTDWHYSVWGSYVELGTAALDSPEKVLEEKLLAGLGDRLSKIPDELASAYSSQFQKELKVQLSSFSTDGRKIGPLTKIIFSDAVKQTGTSALVFTGGSAFGKVLSTIIIKKVGAKIVLKMGSKWAAAAGGASGGAILCAWAGPAAAACAVGGGLLAFFGVDASVNYLDEAFNSDDFKLELRAQLDESKQQQKDYFRDQIEQMVNAQKISIEYSLQDFTLKQLAEADRDSVCSATKTMIEDYERLQNNLLKRSDEEVLKLLTSAEASISKIGLFEISKEIATNLNNFENFILVTPTVLSGRLPSEYEANRKLSGRVKINHNFFSLNKSSPKSNFFHVPISAEDRTKTVRLTDKNTLRIEAEVEQHRILRNRYFLAETAIRRDEFLTNGTKNMIKIGIPFKPKDNEAPLETFQLFLSFKIQAEKLTPLKMKPDCKK